MGRELAAEAVVRLEVVRWSGGLFAHQGLELSYEWDLWRRELHWCLSKELDEVSHFWTTYLQGLDYTLPSRMADGLDPPGFGAAILHQTSEISRKKKLEEYAFISIDPIDTI